MDDFLNRAAAHFAARQRIARRSKEAPQQLIGADTNGFGDPVPRCEQIGDHGDVVSAGLWKQHRAVARPTRVAIAIAPPVAHASHELRTASPFA